MINFNGTTKRRNVNLGGNRRPLRNSSNSYLEQLSLERTKRTKAKEELSAAIKLQSSIRRYQALEREAQAVHENWDVNSTDNNAVVREFAFFAIHNNPNDLVPALKQLVVFVKRTDLRTISETTLINFFVSLVRLYTKLVRDDQRDQFVPISIIVEITLIAYQYIPDSEKIPLTELLTDFNHTLSRFSTRDLSSTVKALFLYSTYDLTSLVQFLSLDYALSLIGVPSGEALEKFRQLHGWIASSNIENWHFSDYELSQILGNFVEIAYTYDINVPVLETAKALANIWSSIHSKVTFMADLEGDDMVLDGDGSNTVVFDFDLTNKLEKLYSKDFMDTLFVEVERGDSFEEASFFLHTSLHMLSSSTSKPTNSRLKTKILTNLIILPSCPTMLKYWFQEILVRPIYANSLLGDRGFTKGELTSVTREWWESFHLFEEVFSYILTFQNDKSIAKFVDSSMLRTFLIFLKNYCLEVAINEKNIRDNWAKSVESSEFDDICGVAFRLFNQLYLRNTRMHFVGDEFWTMTNIMATSLRLNTETVIDLLRRKEMNDDDEQVVFKGRNRQKDESNGALNILIYMPFLIPFKTRAQIFQSLIASDKARKVDDFRAFFFEPQERLHATISRENLLFDAFEAFGDVGGSQFKKRLDVTFVNKFGTESGIDGGGLTKEFLTSVCKDGFQYVNFDDDTLNNDSNASAYNFFKQTPETYQIYPSTDFYWRAKYQAQQTKLNKGKLDASYDYTEENQFFAKMMKFLGMVIGKCLYENILLDISFAPFFLSKWCSVENIESSNPQYKNSFDDLQYLDSKLYESLIKLLSMGDDELNSLDLTFSISEKLPHESKVVTVDLIPGGSSMQVDQSNKLQYIYAVANFKLNSSINAQSKHFLSGLFEIIQPSWLNLFSHTELAMLVSGGEKPVDVEDLKANTSYGGYLESDLTIQYFWEVMEEFTPEERGKLVKFATSSSKAPLLGFKDLNPHFGIRDSLDTDRLPTASTCVNLLKLPNYKNKEILRKKLLYAISAESGFDLS